MFSSVHALVDRQEEVKRIVAVLEEVGKGKGRFLLFRGEGGCGKTRLVQEAVTIAEGRGFTVGFGTGLAESVTPYQPWREALGSLGLAHILDDLPPPKLLCLYLFAHDRELVAKVEREVLPATIVSAVSDVVRDPMNRAGVTVEGQLATCSFEPNRILVYRAHDFAAAAIVQGSEDEALLSDMRELAVTAGSSGGMASTEKTKTSESPFEDSLQRLLDSGKYEGIDYIKDDPKLKQQRLFDRAALALARRAEACPLTLAFDDLQWADPTSLALLHYVARNTRQSRVLLLGSYRVEESGVRLHLKEVMQGLDKEKLVAEVPLTGLGRGDLNRLAESFLGAHALPEEFFDLLWRETRGYPLFVREVLRQLEEEKAIELKGALKRLACPVDQLSIPHRVREVIRARIDRLSEQDRELLEAAATCGTRFTAAFVAKVAGENERSVSPTLDNLARSYGLLRQTENGYAFNHPVVKEVIYDDIPSGTRQALHREAAEWLELVGGPIEDIAEHYYRASDSRAIAKLREAANASRTKFSNSEVIRFHLEALELEKNPSVREEILKDLGSTYELVGEYEDALAAYKECLEISKDERSRAKVTARIGWVHWQKGEFDRALALGTQALTSLRGECFKEESLALHTLARVYDSRGDFDKAKEMLDARLTIHEGVGDGRDLVDILCDLGELNLHSGKIDIAIEYANRSLAMAEKILDIESIGCSMCGIGNALYKKGDFKGALDSFRRSLELMEKVGVQKNIAAILGNIGNVYNAMGRNKEMLEFRARSLRVAERIGDQLNICVNLNSIATAYAQMGLYDDSLSNYSKALDIAESLRSPDLVAYALAGIGRTNVFKGDYREGRERLEKALAIAEKEGTRYLPFCLYQLGISLLCMGEYGTAIKYFERLARISQDTGARMYLCGAYCGKAESSLRMGDLEEALDLGKLALSTATELGAKGHIAHAMETLGSVYREKRIWKDSAENFEAAIRIGSEIGYEHRLGTMHFEFGMMWKKKGDKANSKAELEKALSIFERLKLPGDIEKTRKAITGLGS